MSLFGTSSDGAVSEANGLANRGGGGSGSDADVTNNGYSGGSGGVIISYPDSFANLTSIGGGLTYALTTAAGKKIYTFTAGTGTVTV